MEFIVITGVLALLLVVLKSEAPMLGDQEGDFVAEAFIDWEVCAGSTLYRGRFKSQNAAKKRAQWAARVLDFVLPTHYRCEYSSGRKYWETYGFAIKWGVRPLTEYEKVHGVTAFWSPHLPGNRAFKGEHASAHPRNLTPEVEATLPFKV